MELLSGGSPVLTSHRSSRCMNGQPTTPPRNLLVSVKRVVARRGLEEESTDLAFWLAKSPAERVAEVEVLRLQMRGDDYELRQRLQRVCLVTQLS